MATKFIAARETRATPTAVELFKMFAGTESPNDVDLAGLMRAFADDKSIPLPIIERMARSKALGSLLINLVLRRNINMSPTSFNEAEMAPLLNYLGAHLATTERARNTVPYDGRPAQNAAIDRALSVADRTKFGAGAATTFHPALTILPDVVKTVPIAIIGAGAAGLLVNRTLRHYGFSNVTLFEKRPQSLGIWGQDNVFSRSRNNPLDLIAFDQKLSKAPGDGSSVKSFLYNLGSTATTGIGVEAVTYKHNAIRLTFNKAKTPTKSYPIVINCMGLGKPRSFDDVDKILSTTLTRAVRWQQNIAPQVQKLEGHRFLLVGLGNSTAEMLRQIHQLQDLGVGLDYRVVTHYPLDAVHNPDANVDGYRVFRDVSRPDLTKYHGDLSEFRRDYYRALMSKKIVANVSKITSAGTRYTIIDRRTNFSDLGVFTDTYALVGYHHDEEVYDQMDISYDATKKCGLFHYDGEVISPSSDGTLARGYFALGALLETPEDRNAVVIPGMLLRLGDLAFGVISRAYEYAYRPGAAASKSTAIVSVEMLHASNTYLRQHVGDGTIFDVGDARDSHTFYIDQGGYVGVKTHPYGQVPLVKGARFKVLSQQGETILAEFVI